MTRRPRRHAVRGILVILVLVLVLLPVLHAACRPIHDVGSPKHGSLSFARLPWAAGPAALAPFVGESGESVVPPLVARLPVIATSPFVPPEA